MIRMGLIGRWKCAAHGGSLGINRDAGPLAWCAQHHDWIDAVWVEYVRADIHQGVVEERDRCWQALVDIVGHENWEPKTMGEIAREALAATLRIG